MNIAHYAITRPVNIWLLIVIFTVGGVIGLEKIGRLEDPAFTIKTIKVITPYQGASAEQVEQEVTEPVEIALQQMSQLRRLTSISKPGVSEVTVEMQSHYDSRELPQVWDELRKRLVDLKPSLPQGSGTPIVYDDYGDVYGLYYALTAPDFSPGQMREFARIIRRDLLTVPGVSKVDVQGVLQEQIVAYMDPNHIAGLGVSFPDVVNLLANNLSPASGARLQVGDKKVRILVENPTNKLNEINQLPLVVPGTNRTIKLQDIAQIKLEPVDVQSTIIRYQGHSAITLAVAAVDDVNIVDVGQRVNQKINQLIAQLPLGLTLQPIYDQAQVVDQAVSGFVENLFMSVAVVIITLCVFMGWRSGVVVGSILVVTVMGTILIMWQLGLQLQRISLGAMVIAMGMLVDNAIVVAEGMMLRMRAGKNATEAATFILKRTQWPLLGATVIGIAAFSGIGLSNDSTGEFLYSLFAVILISLLLSWLLAVFVTPLFGAYFYQVGSGDGDQHDRKNRLLAGYHRGLSWCLRHRSITMLVLLLVTIGSMASFSKLKQGFFPPSNTPIFFIHYWGPQDQDIRSTDVVIKLAEQSVLGLSDVESVTSFVGQGAARYTLTYAPQSPNESYGLLMVRAKSSEQIENLTKRLLRQLPTLDLDANWYSERMQFGPSNGAKLAARFSGPDSEVLRQLAEQAVAKLRDDGQVRDIRHDWRDKGKALNGHYDEVSAGVAGISRSDFNDAMQYASSGLQLGQLQDGDYRYKIIAKMANADEDPIKAVENAQVWSLQQRQYVPFRQVSKGIELVSEEVQIRRRNRIRTITVHADPGFNETAASALARIRPVIESIELPPGYELQWGGEYEASKDAQQALGKGLPAGFLAMFVISVLLFGRARQPLIIWLIVPMAVVGVVAGLYVTNLAFSFMALLGFLSLFGMLIKNAIVLLEEIDLQRQEGKAEKLAIVDASISRLRPVSLAAITTILGMAPLLSDPFFADMSVTIMGGLAFATILTLIAVPVLYAMLYRVRYR
ncbi:efflux RND transporter permease subunit [Thalassotalea ponticola]|uniref:efflux RND transporter permease subunit n=1 Tax=Thalassotalea ponticola TaxID=1523392 RepID=UPI0025B3EA75|nr:efflux RND transporter permease subunit [Thalassotalea ponticola]MDN3653258.1 efflux RND transporter permease subunit [Thalassotalea ponticola]